MGKKNKLSDLNDHLFEQLERLNDDDLTPNELEKELRRADGMSRIAEQIVKNADLALRTMKFIDDSAGYTPKTVPEVLRIDGV